MNNPLPTTSDFAQNVANEIRADLQPFDDFGMQVNVAVFWVGGTELHALAHLDRLPVINRTLSVKSLSIFQATQAFLTRELGKLEMLYEMIDVDPQMLMQKYVGRSVPKLRVVD